MSARAVLLCALWALSACVIDEIGTPVATGTRALLVSQGAVTVAGPAGYCVDRAASNDRDTGAFVLLGTCAALTGSAAARTPEHPAILTASVRPAGADSSRLSASFPDMARFFRSPPGRAALAGSGKAADVTVAEVFSRGEVLYIRLADRSTAAGQPVEPEYWRAVLAVRGRMVTLAVQGLRDRSLPPESKRRTLEAFVTSMQAANR